MREEYDIQNLNPRKNPYAAQLKRQITINLDGSTIDYFKARNGGHPLPNTDQPVSAGLRRQQAAITSLVAIEEACNESI